MAGSGGVLLIFVGDAQLVERHHSSILQTVKYTYDTYRKKATQPSEEDLLELLRKLLPFLKKNVHTVYYCYVIMDNAIVYESFFL